MGSLKKSNLITAKVKGIAIKKAIKKPKKVSLSAKAKGKFIIPLPKIKRQESHTKWCEKGFSLFKIIPLFS